MQGNSIMADATPGVVYNVDWYMAYANDGKPYDYTRLWLSDDYGKTWERRDSHIGWKSTYYVANFEGVIYRGSGKISQSDDYGNTWQIIRDRGYSMDGECGLDSCEVFGIAGSYPTDPWSTYHTNNWFDTYTVVPIGDEYVSGLGAGVFRGGLHGEVYITSGKFPDNIYKVSFSADTGYHFKVVYQQQGYMDFMNDRKAGDFYIVTYDVVETQQPWGHYTRICIKHYTDYGETLVDTYCHDLTREGVVTAIGEVKTNDGIIVYPNPTDGELRITNYELRITNVKIFDLMGKNLTLLTSPMSQNITINISQLPTGIYFLRIVTENGVVTKKIIKQ